MQRDEMRIDRFLFHDMHRNGGWCDVEVIDLSDGRTIVIATEVKDNPGMSITNAAEYVATEVCKFFQIEPLKLVWIEHYGYPSPVKSLGPRTHDRVTFGRITPDHEPFFHEPRWTVMKDGDWRALGVEPRPNEP